MALLGEEGLTKLARTCHLNSEYLKRRIGDPQDLEVYLAGLGPVVNQLREILMEAGVPKERIAIERFSTAKGDDDAN